MLVELWKARTKMEEFFTQALCGLLRDDREMLEIFLKTIDPGVVSIPGFSLDLTEVRAEEPVVLESGKRRELDLTFRQRGIYSLCVESKIDDSPDRPQLKDYFLHQSRRAAEEPRGMHRVSLVVANEPEPDQRAWIEDLSGEYRSLWSGVSRWHQFYEQAFVNVQSEGLEVPPTRRDLERLMEYFGLVPWSSGVYPKLLLGTNESIESSSLIQGAQNLFDRFRKRGHEAFGYQCIQKHLKVKPGKGKCVRLVYKPVEMKWSPSTAEHTEDKPGLLHLYLNPTEDKDLWSRRLAAPTFSSRLFSRPAGLRRPREEEMVRMLRERFEEGLPGSGFEICQPWEESDPNKQYSPIIRNTPLDGAWNAVFGPSLPKDRLGEAESLDILRRLVEHEFEAWEKAGFLRIARECAAGDGEP